MKIARQARTPPTLPGYLIQQAPYSCATLPPGCCTPHGAFHILHHGTRETCGNATKFCRKRKGLHGGFHRFCRGISVLPQASRHLKSIACIYLSEQVPSATAPPSCLTRGNSTAATMLYAAAPSPVPVSAVRAIVAREGHRIVVVYVIVMLVSIGSCATHLGPVVPLVALAAAYHVRVVRVVIHKCHYLWASVAFIFPSRT